MMKQNRSLLPFFPINFRQFSTDIFGQNIKKNLDCHIHWEECKILIVKKMGRKVFELGIVWHISEKII